MQRSRRAFLPILLALLAGAALSQAGRLEPGDEQLESGEYFDIYFHDGTAGSTLTVAIRSDDFDPYLIVLDPDGNELLQEDDSPGQGLNVRASIALPSTGSYVIAVTSAFPAETGDYLLSIETAPGAAAGASPLTKQGVGPAPGRPQPGQAPVHPQPGQEPGQPHGGQAPVQPQASQAPGQPATPIPGEAPNPVEPTPRIQPRPGYVTGTVFDTQGRPLAGAGVQIYGTTFEQGQRTSFETVTGPDGTYAIRVPDGRYRASAWVDVTYQGAFFSRHLHPLSGNANSEVDSSAGGNHDFQWRLTGLTAGTIPPGTSPTDFYGASIDFSYCGLPANPYCSAEYDGFPTGPIAPGGSTLRVTLTPIAPLIDGTQGRVLTYEFVVAPQDPEYPYGTVMPPLPDYPNGGGGRTVLGRDWPYHSTDLNDIPLGIYAMTAVATLPDGTSVPLLLGLDPADVTHDSVEVRFEPWEGFHARSYSGGGLEQLDVYVRD